MSSTRASLVRSDIKLLKKSQPHLSSCLRKSSSLALNSHLRRSQRTNPSLPQNLRSLHTTSRLNDSKGPSKLNPNTANKADLDATSPGLRGDSSNAQTAAPNASASGRRLIRLGPLNITVLLLILSGAGWFGWRMYNISTTYPKPVRPHLRRGINAAMKEEWDVAEAAFRQALSTAYSLPPSEFSDEPHLKLTGIAAKLGECLEHAGKNKEAFTVYVETLGNLFEQFKVYDDRAHEEYKVFDGGDLSSASGTSGRERHPDWDILPLSGKTRVRAVGFANRAALLAEMLQNPRTKIPPPHVLGEPSSRDRKGEPKAKGQSCPPSWTKTWNSLELHLRTFSVTQMLYLASNTTGIPTAELSTSQYLDARLPRWLRRLDLAAPCEGLAEYYVRHGDIELALPLYQTSYQFLLPSSSLAAVANLSTTAPMGTSIESPLDATTMCIAASILTAMSAAVLGNDKSQGQHKGSSPSLSGRLISGNNTNQNSNPHIPAVRSWARESRYLVDLSRRVQGGSGYLRLLQGIHILGREDKPKEGEKAAPRSIFGDGAQAPQPPEDPSIKRSTNEPDQLFVRDKRLVKEDLGRIKEADRRVREAEFKEKTEGKGYGTSNWGTKKPESKDDANLSEMIGAQWNVGVSNHLKGRDNPTCERTWAVVLYNTGMIEELDGDSSAAEDYFQLALQQSRKINLLEGVERSKAALRNLSSKKNN
ncbi:hypothetical protein CPB86DRAFT_790178 [Serendipita vermifera]|nr:hypothetical protein CPB86DRAFT_790178 [Serendipita vermifera]